MKTKGVLVSLVGSKSHTKFKKTFERSQKYQNARTQHMLTLLSDDVYDGVWVPALSVVTLCRAAQACHSLHDRTATRRITLHLVYRFLAQSIAPCHRVHCSDHVIQSRIVSCIAFGHTRNVAVTGTWQLSASSSDAPVRRPVVEFLRLDGGSVFVPGVQPSRFLVLLCPSLFPLPDGIFCESFHLSFEEYPCTTHRADEMPYRHFEYIVATATTTVGIFTLRGDMITSCLSGLRANATPAAFVDDQTHVNWLSAVFSFD